MFGNGLLTNCIIPAMESESSDDGMLPSAASRSLLTTIPAESQVETRLITQSTPQT